MSTLDMLSNQSLQPIQFREGMEDTQHTVLTDIYQEDTNMVVWKRNLANNLEQAADAIIESQPTLEELLVVSPEEAFDSVKKLLGGSPEAELLAEDIANLVDMFCCLFDLKRGALRMTVLDRAMCPRFHVDRVPCRLVTTYQGIATEWLPHNVADRSKPDELSGLFDNISDIQQLQSGDVGLMKGELWHNNEGAGLIHRSPQVPNNTRRLVLTLDFMND
jgi:hypothetical protein